MIKVSGKLDASKKMFVGTVTDEKLKVLPGVNVTIKGKDIGAVTNFDGKFRIKVEKGDRINLQYKGLPDTEILFSEDFLTGTKG